MSEPIHLIVNETHDEHEVWCGDESHRNAVHRPAEATCWDCLQAAINYGNSASHRLARLKDRKS